MNEVTVVISPRYSDKLPTIYEVMSEHDAKVYVSVFNRINTIYKAEIKEEK